MDHIEALKTFARRILVDEESAAFDWDDAFKIGFELGLITEDRATQADIEAGRAAVVGDTLFRLAPWLEEDTP